MLGLEEAGGIFSMSGTPCPALAIAFSFSAENSINPERGFEPSSVNPEVCAKLAAPLSLTTWPWTSCLLCLSFS